MLRVKIGNFFIELGQRTWARMTRRFVTWVSLIAGLITIFSFVFDLL